MNKKKITTKKQMYELLEAGALGNRFRIWNDERAFVDAIAKGFDQLVGVRCVGDQPGLPYVHHLTPPQALALGPKLARKHRCPVRYYEASQDEYITIQGEFAEFPEGPMLEWSTARTHMRAAMARERLSAYGPHARLILRRLLTPASYDDILALGEIFPEHVIEFTAYEILVGDIPGRNAVIWEVRHY